MKAMQVYYDINIDIFNNYMNKNRNYESLQNINEINFDNTIFKLINDINQNNNELNNLTCQIKEHSNMKIIGFCIEDNCVYKNKFACQECFFDIHSGHKLIKIEIKDNIFNKLKNCICKINKGIGIFTKIKYKNEIITT